MNRLLFLLLLLVIAVIFALTVRAQPSPSAPYAVTLAWDKSPGTNVITNYAVYYGPASRTYTNTVNARTNLTATVTNLIRGPVYYFSATAKDNNGLESDYSTEVSNSLPTPPNRPANLRITEAGP